MDEPSKTTRVRIQMVFENPKIAMVDLGAVDVVMTRGDEGQAVLSPSSIAESMRALADAMVGLPTSPAMSGQQWATAKEAFDRVTAEPPTTDIPIPITLEEATALVGLIKPNHRVRSVASYTPRIGDNGTLANRPIAITK